MCETEHKKTGFQYMTERKCISIIVTMFNEAEVFEQLFDSLEKYLRPLDVDYEIVCVDDGSTDDTRRLLVSKASSDSRVKAILLSRNFGKEAAMTAAINYATGDAVIPMDADLQDPPEVLQEMIVKWQEGFPVVYARRASREQDTKMKRNSAGLFYKVFNFMSEINIPDNVGDFRLMDRKVIEAIKHLPEKERFMKGLFCWPGFQSATIEYQRPERVSGETKFNYWKLWNFALNGITSFSSLPVRLGLYLGIIVSVFAFLYGVTIAAKTILFGVDVPGYASLMVAILFLGGVQLCFLGALGEYIGRIYKEVKNRPIYWVEDTINVEK